MTIEERYPEEQTEPRIAVGFDIHHVECACGEPIGPDREDTVKSRTSGPAWPSGIDVTCDYCGREYTIDVIHHTGPSNEYPVCIQCESTLRTPSGAGVFACAECGYEIDEPEDVGEYKRLLLESAVYRYVKGELTTEGAEWFYFTDEDRVGQSTNNHLTEASDPVRERLRKMTEHERAESVPPSDEWTQKQFRRLAEAGHIGRQIHEGGYEAAVDRDPDDEILTLFEEKTKTL